MTRTIPSRRLLFAPLVYLAAALLLLEDWFWDVGIRLAARLSRWPPLTALEHRIRALPPYAALCAFVLPALLLLPVKVLALVAVARGHAVSGIAALVVAKLLSAAVVARLYLLTLPALRTLPWFARWHTRFIDAKDRWIARLRASQLYRGARRVAATLRRVSRRLLRRLRPSLPFGSRRTSRAARMLRRFVAMWRARRR
jgi:hypothetical protein